MKHMKHFMSLNANTELFNSGQYECLTLSPSQSFPLCLVLFMLALAATALETVMFTANLRIDQKCVVKEKLTELFRFRPCHCLYSLTLSW